MFYPASLTVLIYPCTSSYVPQSLCRKRDEQFGAIVWHFPEIATPRGRRADIKLLRKLTKLQTKLWLARAALFIELHHSPGVSPAVFQAVR